MGCSFAAAFPLATLACVILILLIGISRVVLSVHYASDVIGGYLLAATFLCIAFILS
jgi:undecaprenyl-diphosphatase